MSFEAFSESAVNADCPTGILVNKLTIPKLMEQDLILNRIHQFYLKSELLDKNNHFIRDGIINRDLFAAQSKRVLFVAKEHNLIQKGEYAEKPNDGYSEWWNKHVHLQFSHRISEWAYGILNDFPAFSPSLDRDIKHDFLRSIAFINVKKSGGSFTAKPQVIWDYIDQTRDLLLEQIGDINPTHIVTCFRYDVFTEKLFGVKLQSSGSKTFGFGIWRNSQVLNFYHPSARKGKQFLYEQLADGFRQLNSHASAGH